MGPVLVLAIVAKLPVVRRSVHDFFFALGTLMISSRSQLYFTLPFFDFLSLSVYRLASSIASAPKKSQSVVSIIVPSWNATR